MSELRVPPHAPPPERGDGRDDVPPTREVPQQADPVAEGTSVVGPLVAAVRHPLWVLLPVLLFVVPSVVAALLSPSTYRANAQVLVGRVDVESTAVPGFVAANQQLAGVYARLVTTRVLAEPVARQLRLEPEVVLDVVSASPVPETSIIRIEGEAQDQASAVLLVDTVADQLVRYVETTAVSPVGSSRALEEFRRASEILLRAQQDRDQAREALAAAQETGLPEAVTAARTAFVRAQADVNAAQLEVDTLASTFRSDLRGSGERNSLQVVSDAVPGGSDLASRLQLAVAAPLLLGLAVGVGAAVLLENRDGLRRLRTRGPDAGPVEVAAAR